MQMKVRPVYVVGRGWPLLPQPDGSLEVLTDQMAVNSKVESLDRQLREGLNTDVALLEPAVLRRASDIAQLGEHLAGVNALLVYVMGLMPLAKLFDLGLPVIAFSGEYTPTMALYAFPVELRESYANLTVALDFPEIEGQIRLLSVRERLRNTRVALIGLPLTFSGHWEHLPDAELVTRKLGVEIVLVSGVEFLAEMRGIEEAKVDAVAREWATNAQAVTEPTQSDILQVARVYLATGKILKKMNAQAAAVGCLEMMYSFDLEPPCFALAALRDEGIPASCEADVSALLTMLVLSYLANKPAYMGNVVRADPENNLVMISHGCTPSRMGGLDQPPQPYTLVHSYSRYFTRGSGLTSFVNLEKGRQVTVARMARNLDRICAAAGEIVGCRDTLCDRTTLDLRVKDARQFFHNAPGNHHVVVYGNHLAQLRGLCRILGMDLVES